MSLEVSGVVKSSSEHMPHPAAGGSALCIHMPQLLCARVLLDWCQRLLVAPVVNVPGAGCDTPGSYVAKAG